MEFLSCQCAARDLLQSGFSSRAQEVKARVLPSFQTHKDLWQSSFLLPPLDRVAAIKAFGGGARGRVGRCPNEMWPLRRAVSRSARGRRCCRVFFYCRYPSLEANAQTEMHGVLMTACNITNSLASLLVDTAECDDTSPWEVKWASDDVSDDDDDNDSLLWLCFHASFTPSNLILFFDPPLP